jgi:hypothetical protein
MQKTFDFLSKLLTAIALIPCRVTWHCCYLVIPDCTELFSLLYSSK